MTYHRYLEPFITDICFSEDLEVAYTTVKRWLNYLSELYYFFELKPYAKSLSRAIKKKVKCIYGIGVKLKIKALASKI